MTSPTISHVLARASGPHICNNRAKYVSLRVSTLFSGEFQKLNNEKLTLGMIVDDLSRGLFIAAFIFRLHARDRAVRCAEMALFESIYLLRRSLQNPSGENQEYHPKFYCPLLRSAECDWNNVGKLEIVSRRA